MAKKRDPWDLSTTAIEKKAKESIKDIAPKTSNTKKNTKSVTAKPPKSVKKVKPAKLTKSDKLTKPAKKVGRPRVTDEPLKVLRVFESVHKLARKMAANSDLTIIEYVNDLIRREYDRTK